MFFYIIFLSLLINLFYNVIDNWLNYFFFLISLLLISYINILYIGKKGFFILNFIFLTFWVVYSNYLFIYFFQNFQIIYYDLYFVYYWDETIPIYLNIYLDIYNFSYINLTLSIGGCAFSYAYSYMRDENYVEKFLFLLLSFLYSMIILLLSNNFILLLLGWELIGITSYLLINFWITKVSTFKAAYKAFTFNRLSDITIIFLLLFFYNFYVTTLLIIDVWYYHYNLFYYYEFLNCCLNGYDLISFFLLIAACCKSAQFGFHTWLPDSMEAPVPASALIHSATLVSAGIYLVNKFWILIIFANFFNKLFLLLSSWTALYGAFIAIYQTDVKRILAYSTISHCGILMLISFLNNYLLLCIYLYSHGFFKSLSFMCVGNIIKTSNNVQDYRYMSYNYFYHKFEYYFLIITLLNLSGYILSIGFFSKHFILITFYFLGYYYYISFFLFFLTALVGFFYTFFLINYLFCKFNKSFKISGLISMTSLRSTTPKFQILAIIILWLQSFFYLFFFYYHINYFLIDTFALPYFSLDYYLSSIVSTKNNFFLIYANYVLFNILIVFFLFLNNKNLFYKFSTINLVYSFLLFF
jgi:NADH-quinone oxidoreductase subunit L